MPTEANEPGAGCRPPPELSSAESGRDCSTSAPAGYDYSHWGPIGSNALRVVTDTLPQILPNVLINKRQEIVPVIIALIQENPVKADRENLARLLFNLVKKPHLEQRKVIISGCISLATVIGPQRTADELMPQMWEQLGHKYPERRALLAEAVGALAGLVDDNVRASAILSILHKLSSDTESDVRLSVVPSMVQLLDFLSPGNKHWMVEEVLFRMVMDRSDVVVSSTFEALLPATLAWAKTMENVYSKLVLNTATHMVELIEDSPYPATTEFGLVHRGEAEMHIPRESQQRKIFCLLSLYTTLIPYVRSSALQHCPSWVNVEPQVEHSGPSEDGGKHTLAHNSTKDSGEGTADSVPEMPLGSEDGAKNNPFLRSPLVETNGAGPGDNPFEADLNNNLLLDSGKPGSNPFLAGNPPVVDATTNPFATKDEQFRVRRSSSAPETNPFVELESQDGEGANPAFTDQQGHGHNTALGHTETNPFLSPKAQSHQPPVPMRSMSSPFSLSGDEGVSGQGGDVSSGLALGGSLAEDEICRKFGQWVEGPNDGSWEEVDMMACQVVPLLIRCCRGVAPLHECDRLRRRLVAAMKLTCGSFGESFTVSAVEPLFVASASIPTCASRCPVAHKVEGIVPTLIPTTLEGTRVGHIALLPVFLAAVLVQSGKGRLSSYIRKLLSDGPEDDTWVLQHRKEFTAAVQFASAFEDVKCHLLGALKDSARSPNPLIKKGVAALVEGLAGTVSAQEVTDTLLPVLASLSSHSDLAVQVTSLGAMQRVSIICSDQPTVVQRLHSQFDAMICEGAHDVQIAVLQTLTMAASQAMVHVEFLLKEILFLLARIQQRSVAGKSYLQLKELAGAAFQALQTLDTCQVKEHSTRLHLLAAMEALNREAPLLEQTQKQLLSAMLRDHSDHTPAMVVPQLAPNPATPRTPRTPKTPKTPRTPKAFLGRSSSMENEQETAGRPAPNHSRVRSAEDAVHGSMFGRGKPAKGTGWHFELPRLPQTNTFL
ncbi:unnamed protein product [Ostreobium quekettii]|uniref:TOG domain-containing protein n=1 Tax=Ostreobium quekettii TaxID=121088 RepID=A0A8S1IRA9_9CHLO|nr:unnamed protein product [Ostreobium quekettii]